MADRVVAAVWAKPRRRVGLPVGIAVFIAAVLLLWSGLSTPSRAARPSRVAVSAAQQQSINGKVTALLNRMTVAEKFGQLEMAGPDGANGTPGPILLDDAKKGLVGSVLDLVGVANINEAQQAALSSRLHIPLIFGLDVIHGYKTMFPVPIGEASSWDPVAVRRDEAISASEATADAWRARSPQEKSPTENAMSARVRIGNCWFRKASDFSASSVLRARFWRMYSRPISESS